MHEDNTHTKHRQTYKFVMSNNIVILKLSPKDTSSSILDPYMRVLDIICDLCEYWTPYMMNLQNNIQVAHEGFSEKLELKVKVAYIKHD